MSPWYNFKLKESLPVSDLTNFNKDSLQQLADNLRRPGGCDPVPNPAAQPGSTIPTAPFVFGAKSQRRIAVACDFVKYYRTVGCDLTAANLQWNTVMKNFDVQWTALKEKKGEDSPETPKISKALPVIKWMEAFQDFLNRKIGNRNIPLMYIIRDEPNSPALALPLAPGQPHSVEHGSVEAELIAQASHTHALFQNDNSDLYFLLEEATRGSSYAASIKPFQRHRDGEAAWKALTSQYAGKDKWDAEIKKPEQLLHTCIWIGQSNFSLEHFISQHRNAYVSMSACAEHIKYQLPNKDSRVGFPIDAIQCADAGLQAAMASVKTNNGPNGLRNNFEKAISHLLPYDPVAKKRATGIKRGSALISLTEAHDGSNVTIAANDSKPSIRKTGVHLRYHKHHEYMKITHEQRRELSEWRQNNPDAHKPTHVKKPPHAKKTRITGGPVKSKQISMLVSQQVAAEMKKYNPSAHAGSMNTDGMASADDDEHLMAMVQSAVSKHFAAQTTQFNPIRRLLPSSNPTPNWKEAIEQLNRRMNKST